MLGHLAAGEEYHLACLDGTVAALLARYADRGASNMDSLNALGVADRARLETDDVLAQWRAANLSRAVAFESGATARSI